jgi:hypothetical protein
MGGGNGSSAGGAGAIAIGGDVIRSILVTGGNLVFVGDYERIKDAYINPAPVFARVRIDRFKGRSQLAAQLQDFFSKRSNGYFVLEGEAGLGKSAFFAHLVKENGYIHHFVELAPGPAGVVPGLKNLAAQLIPAWELGPSAVDGALPTSAGRPDFLQGLLFEAAARRGQVRPDEKIVLVIDALDEAAAADGQNGFVLPPVLPPGVYVLVSQRSGAWPPAIQTPRQVARLEASSTSNLDDIREFLDSAVTWPNIAAGLQSGEAAAQSGLPTPETFKETLLQKCNGVWVYLNFILDEIERGDRSTNQLATLPDNLWQYYARYWQRWRDDNAVRWAATYLPLIATLAAAREAVSLSMLCDLANVPEAELDPELLSLRWRPFLSPEHSQGEARYRLYHASLREFLEGRIDRHQLTEAERVFADSLATATRAAHQRIIARCRSTPNTDWTSCDEYGLRNLVGHLQAALELEPTPKGRARRAADLYSVVLDEKFRAAQRAGLGDLHASLTDLRTTLQLALDRNDLVDALACVGAYRTKAGVGVDTPTGVADETIAAAAAGDFDHALRNAAHYEVEPD